MTDSDDYAGREQTLVKHYILQHYLERFAHIVGSRWGSITYVDCFSGPWNVRSEDLRDSSFHIAITELRKARETLRKRGRDLTLRCFFLEKEPEPYARLREFADGIDDVQIETRKCELAGAIGDIVAFVRKAQSSNFPFIFIDPTGWTGFEMGTIAPLLQLDPCEVLINFMTEHIRRFIQSAGEQTGESFVRLFGSAGFRPALQGLAGQDREDAAVQEYCKRVSDTGEFPYVCTAIVLHPDIGRTYFHLVYATRNPKGVEVFKECEKRAMRVMGKARASAKQRKRKRKSGQLELFPPEQLHDPSDYNSLRERYLAKARDEVLQSLQSRGRVPYDDLWALTVPVPLVWPSDLKEWLQRWEEEARLHFEGMGPRERVPKRARQNCVIWHGEAPQ